MLLGKVSDKVIVATIREAHGLKDLIAEGVVKDVWYRISHDSKPVLTSVHSFYMEFPYVHP